MNEVKNADTWILLTAKPLAVDAVAAFLRDERAGAINLFLGTTRQWTRGMETLHLEYEAYEGMAVEEMQRIAREAVKRWPVEKIALHHRTGVVGVAESSVLIGVSTPHRADSFDATRFLIDSLKETVPIWKCERYASGEVEWVRGSGRGGEAHQA